MAGETATPAAKLHPAQRLFRDGRFAQAVEAADAALPGARRPDALRLVKAKAQFESGDPRGAFHTIREMSERSDVWPDKLFYRALSLSEIRDLSRALEAFDALLALRPDHALGLFNKGNLQRELHDFEGSIASYGACLDQKPGFVHALINRGLSRLLLGDLSNGLEDFSHRWNRPEQPINRCVTSKIPEWKGEPIEGKRLALFAEQGMGDAIQFCRFAGRMRDLGAEVTIVARSMLHRLLKSLTPGYPMAELVTDASAFDYQLSMIDVPRRLGLEYEDIAREAAPYLGAEPELIELWRSRLPGEGFRIGICWQGNPTGKIDQLRSPPLAAYAPLSQVEGVRLISLQKHDGLDQLDALPAGMHVERIAEPFDEGGDAFVDTAAIMETLDLIVTSDTAIAHLAGALGRPVWVALPYLPDWRWMIERPDSPWYPSMRLFRQDASGIWPDLFEQMAAALRTQGDFA